MYRPLIGGKPTRCLLLAGLGAGVLAWVGVWLAEVAWPAMDPPDVILSGAKLELLQGQGEFTGNRLLVHRAGPGHSVLALGALPGVPAEQFSRVCWRVSGLNDAQVLQIVWMTSVDPETVFARTVTVGERETGQINLRGYPGWRGHIVRIGLTVKGALAEPLSIVQLSLDGRPPELIDTLREVTADWSRAKPWSMRSINFFSGAKPSARLTPVAEVAVWLGLGALLYGLFCRVSAREFVSGAAILLLAGWFALDVRWQWQLTHRLGDTMERYAGLDQHDRKRAALDGALASVTDQIRRHMPRDPTRLIILSDDPHGYLPGRVCYHLLPHRGYAGLSKLPQRSQVGIGDYILLLSSLRTVRYDIGRQRLVDADSELPVELQLSIPGFGRLFRIRGGS